MNLCLDLGNTRIKYGIYSGPNTVITGILEEKNYSSLLAAYDIQSVIYSSTRKHLPRWLRSYISAYPITALDHLTKIPIENLYQTPETLGRDRIAAVVAAHQEFPNKNNLVIDAGTCITLDYINRKGQFLGGNISPGIKMRIKAMNRFTGKLPVVESNLPIKILGSTTETALQNGAVLGTIMEIEAFIQRVSDKYGAINIILTGGDANFLATNLKTNIFVSPNLVLQGLNEILKYNVKHS